jgi:YHS domain-containing protein
MKVDEKKASTTAQQQGKTYYFCSPACRDAFAKNPEKFVGGKAETRHGC